MVRLALLAAGVCSFAACFFDAAAPPGAALLCTSTGECPPGTVCARAVGTCAPEADLVRGGTEVSEVRVSPERAGPGMTVEASFRVVEPLDVLPAVEMVLGGETLTLTLSAGTGPSYSASGVINAGMTSGPWAVRLSLVDAAGESSDETLGGVDVDTLAPSVTIATLSDSPVVPDAPLQLSLSLTEPATVQFRATPRDGGAALELALAPEPIAFSLATPGTWDLTVTLADDVGNIAANIPVGTVEVDGRAPALLSQANIVLRPPPGGRLDTVTALAVGGTAEVFFALDEPVAALPVVTASDSAASLTLDRIAGDVVAFTYRLQVPVGTLSGSYEVAAQVTDEAGNDADLVLGIVEVDVDRPEPPAPAALTFTRKPTRLGGDRFSVSAPAGTFESTAVVVLQSDPRPGFGFEIASARADANGGVLAVAGNEDRARVYVSQVDAAGNESDAVLARNVEVVIDLENKTAGSSLANPHRALLFGDRPRAPGSPQLPVLKELDGRQVGNEDGAVATHQTSPTWQALADETPQRFQLNNLTWDSARGVAVRTGGGFGAATATARTWFWDGRSWESTEPIGSPSAFGAQAFDAARELVVSPGIQDAFTWSFDGTRWVPRAVPGPAPIIGGAASYDEATARVLYFAGAPNSDADSLTNALWAWDGASWEQLVVPDPQPPPRIGPVMAPLPGGGQLMFGGLDLTDTWILDGNVWTEQFPSVVPPSPPLSLAMASSPDQVMLVANGAPTTLTFFWSNGDWVPGPPITGAPSAFGCALSWDPIEGVFLFVINDRSFVFDGTAWSETGRGPGPRHNAALIADVDVNGDPTGPLLLAGGSAGANETWLLDGDAWSPLSDPQNFNAPRPVFTGTENLVVDPSGVYRRIAGAWTQVGSAPPGDVRGAAWDETAGELVVTIRLPNSLPNSSLTATWTESVGWVVSAAETPTANDAMAWDPVTSSVLLLTFTGGALGQTAETWAWSGTSWEKKLDGSSAVRDRGRLVLDPTRGPSGQLVAVGGVSTSLFGFVFATGLETWTGSAWEPLATENDLEGRADPAVVFREDLQRVAVFGGDVRLDGDTNDLRLLETDRAPAVLFDAVLATTQLPRSSLAEIRARCVASGTGGVRTSVFARPGIWRELARDETALANVASVEGSMVDVQEVRAATHGPELHMACDALARQPNSQISVDYLQVVLRYLLDDEP